MNFSISKSIQILSQTPFVLSTMLSTLDDDWVHSNEGADTWSVYDIIGHLIHGEKTDWIPRMEVMLSETSDKNLEPFDRFAQFLNSKGKSITELLTEFGLLRKRNLERLNEINFTDHILCKTAIHPEFGTVILKQHLSTWVAHDLGHIAQVCRVMAKQYKEETGPWVKYLRILQS